MSAIVKDQYQDWLARCQHCGTVSFFQQLLSDCSKYRGFQNIMAYLYYISCLRYTILVGNPRYLTRFIPVAHYQVAVTFHRQAID